MYETVKVIRLSDMDEVKDFVRAAGGCDFDIDVKCDRTFIDAKSLLCMKRQKEVVSTLETLEEIWGEYEVYSRDELDPMKRSFFPDETAGGKDE